MKALVNGDIYTGTEVLFDHAVIFDRGIIVAIVPSSDLSPEVELLNASGRSICPGFVDLQVNGAGGVLFNDSPSMETIGIIASAIAKFGVTSFLPTLITCAFSKMRQARDAVETYMSFPDTGVLGIHYEGPFLSKDKAGVHNKHFIRPSADPEVAFLCEKRTGYLRLVTLAPESVGQAHLAMLIDGGCKISLGHTNCSGAVAKLAIDSGVRSVTHLHNAMSAFTSRLPGVAGAAMADPRAWAGLICDGFHVDFMSVRASYNAWKGHRDLFLYLVTDAMPPVGSDIESFMLDELEIVVKDGKCQTADGTLGGSKLDMATAVRNCIQKVGIPKDEALRMASTYPALFAGVSQHYGYIRPGARADFAIFDNEIHVHATMRSGELIFGSL